MVEGGVLETRSVDNGDKQGFGGNRWSERIDRSSVFHWANDVEEKGRKREKLRF